MPVFFGFCLICRHSLIVLDALEIELVKNNLILYFNFFTQKTDIILLISLSLKLGNSFNFVKFGMKSKTSFLNVSKFDKFSFLPSLFKN